MAVLVVEVSPVLHFPAADEKVTLDEAVGGGPHPHHDDPAQDDLCTGEVVLSGEHGCLALPSILQLACERQNRLETWRRPPGVGERGW